MKICRQSQRLRRELHRVTPLRHVLHLLPLVDLMDQIRRMIYQPHRRFAGNPGTAQPVDVGNAQTVETQMRLFDLDKELLPAARRLKGKFDREFLFGLADAFKQRAQRGRHRNGKCPFFAAFG